MIEFFIFVCLPIFAMWVAIGSFILVVLVQKREKDWYQRSLKIRRNRKLSDKQKQKLLGENVHPANIPWPRWWKILNPFV